jgi:hypothetical protein
MAHECHAIGCTACVPAGMFMCKRHWFSLPKPLRDRIWATYRPGQEDDKQPTKEYCEAAKECLRLIAAKEGRQAEGTKELKLYDVFAPDGLVGRLLDEIE